MNCQIVQKHLTAYMKNGLDKQTHRQFALHIATCDPCAQQLDEARLLEEALYAEAASQRPFLSRTASQRIQQNMAQRLQRALWWQRTRTLLQTGVTVALTLFIFGFLLSTFWLSLQNEVTNSSVVELAEREVEVLETAVPTVLPQTLLNDPNSHPSLTPFDSLQSATPGFTPEQLSHLIVETALQGDEEALRNYFVAMPSWRDPTITIWRHFARRCASTVQASDLEYLRISTKQMVVVSVNLIYDDAVVGEIKLRQFNGEWFAIFTRPPAVNQCLIEQRSK